MWRPVLDASPGSTDAGGAFHCLGIQIGFLLSVAAHCTLTVYSSVKFYCIIVGFNLADTVGT